jgi:hypothetical protein
MLGQVRLVQASMGQEYGREQEIAAMAAALIAEISRLEKLAEALPETTRLRIARKAADCRTAADAVTLTPSYTSARDRFEVAKACISELKKVVDEEIARPAPMPAPAGAAEIPTWGYVVGSLAIVGLVAYVATR